MKDSENKMIMARNIQRYMDQHGISRQQLCDDLDIKYTTLRDWITGITYPRIGKVEAMAQYFGCKKSDLIEDKKERPTSQGDELSDDIKELISCTKDLTKDKIQLLLQIVKTIR